MPKAAFYTLGCRLNQTESGIMAKSLENIGYEITEDQDNSDLCVINTCTVTNQSNAKCRKKIRSIQKRNPSAKIAVVGCFSQLSSEQISEIGGIDLILGNKEKFEIPRYLDELESGHLPLIRVGKLEKAPFSIDTIGQHLQSTRANLKIQDGCDFICSFCVIPKARGRSRPRNPENIREELRELESQGVKEIILTGVNLGTFQYDELQFVDLLEVFEDFKGIERVRISSIEPTTVGADIFTWMSGESKVLPHLHLPLQSGNDEILSRMRRRYTIREYIDFISQAKKEVPGICIGSDVIVGFPGESTEMFDDTYQVLESAPIDYFHVFPYAEREGTTSEKIVPKVNEPVIQKRATLLRKLSDQKRSDFISQFHSKPLKVLFEKQTDGIWKGYSENYIRVAVKSDLNLKNEIRSVLISDSSDGIARGEIVK